MKEERKYCIVLKVPDYHPQLCGNDGTYNIPMSKEEAEEALSFTQTDGEGFEYLIMEYEIYLAHIPDCDDCKALTLLKERINDKTKDDSDFIFSDWLSGYSGSS